MKFLRMGFLFFLLFLSILALPNNNRDKIIKRGFYYWNEKVNASVARKKCDIITILEQNNLTKSILDDNIEQVKKAIAQGCDVNLKLEVNMSTSGSYCRGPVTPLKIGVLCGNPEIVQLLINSGAVIKKEDSYVRPLGIAIEEKNKEIAQLLISAGAQIDDDYLRGAIFREDVGMVDLLLANGAKIDNCVELAPLSPSMIWKKGLSGRMMNIIRSRVGIWPIIKCKVYDVWLLTLGLCFRPPVFLMLVALGCAENKTPVKLALPCIVAAATVLSY